MLNPFIRKLRHGAQFTESDERLLAQATQARTLRAARTDLLREGDPAESAFVVLEGLACRYKRLPRGERQITALLLPGDSCELHTSLRREADDSIATLTRCILAVIPRRTVQDWVQRSPSIAEAVAWAALVDQAILREWLVNLGGRNATERTAHLFCELYARSQAVGLGTASSFVLPLTQEDLANLLGLSPVHLNRILGRLRGDNLLQVKRGAATINDLHRLATFAGFDGGYLYLRTPNSTQAPSAPRNVSLL